MFNIILRFSDNKLKAPHFMQAHKDWIAKGFDDGVFISVGSLLPANGGVIWAYRESFEEISKRVGEDPFVKENIVTAEIQEISPARLDPRIDFLRSSQSAA